MYWHVLMCVCVVCRVQWQMCNSLLVVIRLHPLLTIRQYVFGFLLREWIFRSYELHNAFCFSLFILLLYVCVISSRGESTVLKGHTGAVRSVRFSADSRHLITGSNDKLVKVQNNLVASVFIDVYYVECGEVWLIFWNVFQIWQLPSRKFQCSLVGHSNWVRTAELNHNATVAASGGDDKTVKLWDVGTHQCLHTFYDHTE